VRGAAPFFLPNPIDRSHDGVQPLMQTQPWSAQRRSSVVCNRTADRQTVAANCRRFRILSPFQRPFEWAHAAHMFLQRGFGVAVSLEDG
jgi:hypothetical protein